MREVINWNDPFRKWGRDPDFMRFVEAYHDQPLETPDCTLCRDTGVIANHTMDDGLCIADELRCPVCLMGRIAVVDNG